MSYHIFNNFAELLKGDIAAKIGQGIFSKYLMNRECNCSIPSKVNIKCVYKDKCRSKYLIYEVQYSMWDSVHIGNTQQTFKKIMNGHFSDLVHLSKNGKKYDSFAAHFGHNFNSTTSCTDICNYITLKVVNQLNPIGAIKKYMKPNCNLFVEELFTILKKLRNKRVTIINKNSEIYGACRHKKTFHQFCISTDDTVFNG